jgi:hypothetical protein
MSGSNAQAKNQARQKAQLKQLLKGGKVHWTGAEVFYLLGKPVTAAELLAQAEALLQPHLDLDDAMAQARVLTDNARANVRVTLPGGRRFLDSARGAILSQYGKGNPLVKSFGVPTGLRRALTTAEKVEAVGARLLTRQERHTLGKRQKQKIKGGKATLVLTGPDGKPLSGSKKGSK